jgi:hypothetical protein
VAAWAPDLSLEAVSVDRSHDPMTITVTVTGDVSPPRPGLLAEQLARALDRAVDIEVTFVFVDRGSAPAP